MEWHMYRFVRHRSGLAVNEVLITDQSPEEVQAAGIGHVLEDFGPVPLNEAQRTVLQGARAIDMLHGDRVFEEALIALIYKGFHAGQIYKQREMEEKARTEGGR